MTIKQVNMHFYNAELSDKSKFKLNCLRNKSTLQMNCRKVFFSVWMKFFVRYNVVFAFPLAH